ncbi:MAG: AsmA-like C-terminal region-containing protein, partial [Pseudomonadales bacterium]
LGPYGLSGRLVKKDENYNVTNLAGHLGDKESANRFAIDTGLVTVAADEPIQLSIEGKVGERPFGVTATGGTPDGLIAPVKPWPIELSATGAGARLEIKGTIAEPLKARGLDLRLSIGGKQLAELASLLRTPLPRLGPYRFSGRVRERDSGYAITGMAGYLGRADRPAHVVIRTGRILLPANKALRLNLEGTYEKTPLRVSFTGGPLVDLTAPTKPWPVKLDASGAGATLVVRGTVARPSAGAGFDLRVDLKGRRLSRLARLLTLTLPEVDSYTASGRIRDRHGSYVVTKLQVQADDTDLSGSLSLKRRGTRPKLSAKLASRMFDVGKLIVPGAAATDEPGKFSLDDKLPIDWLRAIDADLEVEIGRIVGAPMTIRELAMSAKLESGKATLTLTHGSLLDAAVAGALTLDASADTPRMVLDLSTKGVDLDKAVSALARSERLQGTTGNMELHLASSGRTLRALIEQARLTLDAQAMELSYRSQPDGTVIPVKISTARATAIPGEAVTVVVEGAVRDVPIKLDLAMGTLLNFAAGTKTWPIRVELNAADAVFKANGVVAQPLEGEGFDVGFDLRGKELSALNRLLGMELPTMGPYELSGRFANGAGTHHLHQLQIGLGKHRAAGQVRLTTTKPRPHIAVKLEAGTLDIDHLVELLKEREQRAVAEPADQRVIPDLALSGESLPQVDIELEVDVTDVLAQAIDIGDVRIKANLNNGRLAVSSFKAKLFGGYISGNLEIDSTGEKPAASIKLTVRHLDYGAWLKGWQITDAVTGKVDLNINLSGHGKTLRTLLGNANGAVVLVSGPTHIAGSDLGVWGAGLTSGLMSITSTALGIKKATEFNCMVWPFNVSDGVARSDAIVMDTHKITIEGNGTVNLATEEMDIVLKPARKRASLFSIQNPVRISGPLTNPKRTTLRKGETATKAGLVFLTAGVFLIFTASTGTRETNPCVAALSAADTGGVSAEKQKKDKEAPPELGLVGELLGAIQKPVDEVLDASDAESNQGQ